MRTAPDSLFLTKYQALSNDYLLSDRPGNLERLLPLVPRLCDRHVGLGADGLLLLDAPGLHLRVFNPDRSEAEKSGNGLRIAACHLVLEHGAPDAFSLRTADRDNPVRITDRRPGGIECELDVGVPRFDPDGWLDLDTAAGRVRCRVVDIGNPHLVVFGQEVTAERCRELGPLLETDPRFPRRTNVQLVEPQGEGRARIEIWERGAGYTLGSGTSACAVAAALHRVGLAGPTVDVVMPGGTLRVHEEGDGHLVQTGPADRVYRAEVRPSDLSS